MKRVKLLTILASIISLGGGIAQSVPLNYITIFEDQPHRDPRQPFPYVNPQAPQGGQIVLGHLGTFDSFYPFFLKGKAADGVDLLYATLFKPDQNTAGVAYPYVAESVEVFPTQVTFKIRKEATFSDGTPITASDVAFSFKFLIKNQPMYQQYYQAVKGVETRDSQTVVFLLKENAPKESASILSQLPVLSEKFFTTHDVQKKPLTLPVGSGPYVIKDFQQGRFVIYEKVSQWWGNALAANQGFYNFQTIRFDSFRELPVLFEAFKKGDIDVFIEPMAKNWAKGYDFPAVREGKIKKEEIPIDGGVGFSFLYNLRTPLFQDINVRKAIALVFPFEEINTNLFFKSYHRLTSLFQNSPAQAKGAPSVDELSVLNTLDSHTIPSEVLTETIEQWASPSGNEREKRKKALDLLAQSGWRLKNGIQTHPEKGELKFTFLVSDPLYEKVLQRMKGALSSIGISMDMRLQDPAQYKNTLSSFGFDMTPGFLTLSSHVPGNELLAYLGSNTADTIGGRNLAGVKNASVDALIQKILAAQSYNELLTLCKALDRVVMASYYAVPGWTMGRIRLAYWDKFGRPEQISKQGVDFMTWWKK